jgi:type VI secretion system protein ImpB
MSQSFQKEKPPARINLFLEVAGANGPKKVELPLRMLMVGDYTGREDDTPLEDRENISINKDNFDAVMGSMDISADFTVANTIKGGDEEMKVDLSFENIKSFTPEAVAKQVPELTRLLAMRNLLQDLRNRVVSGREFRKQLDSIVTDKDSLEKLTAELDKLIVSDDEPAGGES